MVKIVYIIIWYLIRWVFDDAMVKEVGYEWQDVPPRCLAGKFQPALLFYEEQEVILKYDLS